MVPVTTNQSFGRFFFFTCIHFFGEKITQSQHQLGKNPRKFAQMDHFWTDALFMVFSLAMQILRPWPSKDAPSEGLGSHPALGAGPELPRIGDPEGISSFLLVSVSPENPAWKKRLHFANWKDPPWSTMLFMGKLTILTGPFWIAMLPVVYQRVVTCWVTKFNII